MLGKVIKNKQMKHNKIVINFSSGQNTLFIVFLDIQALCEYALLVCTIYAIRIFYKKKKQSFLNLLLPINKVYTKTSKNIVNIFLFNTPSFI